MRFLLCDDLIRAIQQMNRYCVFYHPLLRNVYHNEAELISSGMSAHLVLINTGGVFVEEEVNAFKSLGFTSFCLTLTGSY